MSRRGPIIETFESVILDEQKALTREFDCIGCDAYAQGAKDALEWIRTGQNRPSLGILKEAHGMQPH